MKSRIVLVVDHCGQRQGQLKARCKDKPLPPGQPAHRSACGLGSKHGQIPVLRGLSMSPEGARVPVATGWAVVATLQASAVVFLTPPQDHPEQTAFPRRPVACRSAHRSEGAVGLGVCAHGLAWPWDPLTWQQCPQAREGKEPSRRPPGSLWAEGSRCADLNKPQRRWAISRPFR